MGYVFQSGKTALNPFDPAFNADPYPLYQWLREYEPVHKNPLGFWAISRYEDVENAFSDQRFSSAPSRYSIHRSLQGKGTAKTRLVNNALTFMDPPTHNRPRSLLAKVLTKQIAEKREALIAHAIDDLLTPHLARGEIDIIKDLAIPLPTRVISDFLGIPESDRNHLRNLAAQFFPIFSPMQAPDVLNGIEHSIGEFEEYLRVLINERRSNPGDDLLSELIHTKDGDEHLSDEELVASCILLFSNGVEALSLLIGNALLALLKNRSQLDLLHDNPELLASAVDEFLRYDTPSQAVGRTTLEPVTLHGIDIPAQSPVYLLIGSANRDPDKFVKPDGLDITRPNNRHLSFGSGIHACLGAKLVRTELQLVFAELLGKTRNIVPVTRELCWRKRVFSRGLESLRIRFDTA